MSVFLEEPRITLDREDGKVVSAYIQLRDGFKAVGTIQPSESALAFFLIASDGLPIGIRLMEPVTGVAVCELFDTVVGGRTQSGIEGVRTLVRNFDPDRLGWSCGTPAPS